MRTVPALCRADRGQGLGHPADPIQELVRESLHAITRCQPQTDKVMRMHAQTAMIENGFVVLSTCPDAAPWLAPYLREPTVFPHHKHM
jgi:phage terminase large subunit-like protein